MSNGPELPPPGWYQDPENLQGPKRWWDGSDWTDRRRMDGPQPPAPGQYDGAGFPAPTQPAGYPAGWGVTDLFPSLDRALSFGGRSLGANWLPLAITELFARVGPAVALQYALIQVLDGMTIHNDGSITGFDSSRLGALGGVAAISLVLGLIGVAIEISLLLRFLDTEGETGSKPSMFSGFGAAIGHGLRRLLPVLGWYLIAVIAIWIPLMLVFMLIALLPPLGILVMFALIPLGVYLFVRLGFFVIAAIDRPGNPFSRSLRVSAGRFWQVFGVLVVAWIAIFLVAMVLSFFSGLFAPPPYEPVESTDAVTFVASDSVVGLVVLGFTNLLLGTFVSGFGGGTATLLYRSANPRPTD